MQTHLGRLLLLSVTFSIALVAARVFRCHTTLYISFIWNLFLAWIPFFISQAVNRMERFFSKNLFFYGILLVWLLFFPNAPYILTDLFHLEKKQDIPLWYDLLLILSFAWNGLIIGYISLMQMEMQIRRRVNKKAASIFVLGVLCLAAYGVFLGRFLRWNSWDVFTDPFTVAENILHMARHPLHYPGVWGMTTLLAVFLTIVYFTIRAFRSRQIF